MIPNHLRSCQLMARAPRQSASNGSAANLGFEAELWAAADTLRGNIESAEYEHVVLGLLSLKHVSDAFEERHAELVKGLQRKSSERRFKRSGIQVTQTSSPMPPRRGPCRRS
jgi:type I restriction-modification system DNA methylase subunit